MTKPEDLADVHWRLRNLYYIVDKKGQRVLFQPNETQSDFLENCTSRDIILKARQLGFTTLMCIVSLDECLFHPNHRAGIIAHKIDDAQAIFETKVKFAYDNLPDDLKALVSATQDRAGALKFSNGSGITVSTSYRSGTLTRLHVSEFGKICATAPNKAREIVTGAFPAAENGAITIESTAEGQDGAFYEMVQEARRIRDLGPRDFKFHFYPWHIASEYRLQSTLPIDDVLSRYFDKLRMDGITLDDDQKQWYMATQKMLGADMRREHPSTPDEAFEQAIEGSYFEAQLSHAYAVEAIGRFPHDPRYYVNTFWDLGMNDQTAIWLHQSINGRNRFIGYYENSGEQIAHYLMWLRDWSKRVGAQWGDHYMPHDSNRRDMFIATGNGNRLEMMAEYGFHPNVVPRVTNKSIAIDAARSAFPTCDFDESACKLGLKRLQHYRKEWDDLRGVWKDKPRHDINSNGADAFMTFATGYQEPQYADDYDEPEQWNWNAGRNGTTGY